MVTWPGSLQFITSSLAEMSSFLTRRLANFQSREIGGNLFQSGWWKEIRKNAMLGAEESKLRTVGKGRVSKVSWFRKSNLQSVFMDQEKEEILRTRAIFTGAILSSIPIMWAKNCKNYTSLECRLIIKKKWPLRQQGSHIFLCKIQAQSDQ